MHKTKKISRIPIGRDLAPVDLNSKFNESHEKSWKLESGHSIKYKEIFFSYEDLLNKVEVNFEVNGRLQAYLKPENLADITATIGRVQYKNIVLRQLPNQKWEVLEGSRRLAGALIMKVGLRADCIEDVTIPRADAMALADEMRYTKEHNLYELGKRWLFLKTDPTYPLEQKEIAEKFKVSEAKVSRAIQSASVCDELMILFPDVNELVFSQFKQLLAVQQYYADHQLGLTELIDSAKFRLKNEWSQFSNEKITEYLLQHFKQTITPPKKASFVIEPMLSFSNKNSYARKKLGDRKVHYEFSRVKPQVVNEIDQAIRSILAKHYS